MIAVIFADELMSKNEDEVHTVQTSSLLKNQSNKNGDENWNIIQNL